MMTQTFLTFFIFEVKPRKQSKIMREFRDRAFW